jgi:Polyketide cyclase / dehydrase and lipid transport
MSTVKLEVPVAPYELFAVLSDGWMYASWVVGASHIRDVDENWPEPGARIHHTVGVWPLTISDTTEVVESEPNRLIVLDARAFPAGRAAVRIELHPAGPGRTRIEMTEKVTGGPGQLVPSVLTDPLLGARNRESLRRLTDIAQGRHLTPSHGVR